MNKLHFTNPELSAKLEKLDVVSEFNMWWVIGTLKGSPFMDKKINARGYQTFGQDVKMHVAYHFSDLLLPENAKKIWGKRPDYDIMTGIPLHIGELLQRIFNHELYKTEEWVDWNWQNWLEREVNKALEV